MIRRTRVNGLPFEIVGCDSLYGRDTQFRADVDAEGALYMANIPENIHVYTTKPVLGVPANVPGKRGRPYSRVQVINNSQPVEVRVLGREMTLTPVAIRHRAMSVEHVECGL
jgi:SRSO17 transposase